MKRTLVTCLLAALALAGVASGEEPKKQAAKGETAKTISPPPPAAQQDSPLVKAAKAAQKSRAKSAAGQRVITDESVKKSKGKLTVLAESTAPPAEAVAAADQAAAKERAARQAEADTARLEVKKLEGEVAVLEKELATIEAHYYDEYDSELRDNLWEESFGAKKAALQAARERLAAARKRFQDLSAAPAKP